MKVLLDTHALLWWLDDDPRLATDLGQLIERGDVPVGVSSATTWELSIKQSLGKIKPPEDVVAAIDANRFTHVPISLEDGVVAGGLPMLHRDPFDRMLVAQAQRGDWIIATRDPAIVQYEIETISA